MTRVLFAVFAAVLTAGTAPADPAGLPPLKPGYRWVQTAAGWSVVAPPGAPPGEYAFQGPQPQPTPVPCPTCPNGRCPAR